MQKTYMDTNSFVIHIKNKDVDEEIAYGVRKGFDTSNTKIWCMKY